MVDTPKILAQAAPLSGALTNIYTVPAATSAVVNSINICNTTNAQQTIRLTTAQGGSVDITSHTLYNYLVIPANDTFERTSAIMLAAGDIVRAQVSASGTVAVNLYGVEIS